MICTYLSSHECEKIRSKTLKEAPRKPRNKDVTWIRCQNFWIEQGTSEPIDWATSTDGVQKFVVTDSVRTNLQRLSRCLSAKRYPVLLQGPTSSGKKGFKPSITTQIYGNLC